MTSAKDDAQSPADVAGFADDDTPADPEAWAAWADATEAELAARDEARFFAPERSRWLKPGFLGLLLLALLVHAAMIAAFLWRDAHTRMQVARIDETPVEVIVEQPEPPKPKPPPQPKPPEPPPPKPKEDLRDSLSAPRAPSEDKIKTQAKEAKTAAPTELPTPTPGQPQAKPATAAPTKTERAETKQDQTAKQDDKTDAAALDKAKRNAKAKQSKTKEAKESPRPKQIPNALAALAGAPSLDSNMTFAKPTPKTKIYGGTDDVRWMSEVVAMVEAKIEKLPRTERYQAGGFVAICFHVDVSGRVILKEYCQKSGYPDIDSLAMRALMSAQPFPPPPPGLERGLIFSQSFDGQLPTLHFR